MRIVMTVRTTNNPSMLRWARKDIGLSIDQAAQAIGISDDILSKAESGGHKLTLNQLRKAAEIYEFPFGYFYLSSPPSEIKYKSVPDYRIAPNFSGMPHHRINLEIKKCRERREVYLDLASSMGYEITNFKELKGENQDLIGSSLRERLNINEADIRQLPYDKIYTYWKQRLEEDGVLVYETLYIPAETGVIGASLFYEKAPIILIRRGGINSVRKLFTLMHEYAHLLLGRSGINDVDSLTVMPSQETGEDIEYRCNQLASKILAPEELIILDEYKGKDPVEMMELLSIRFKITYSSAAVCLRKVGLISQGELTHLLELRKQEYKNREQKRGNKKIKIPREIINKIDLGKPLFDLALSAYSAGVLDIYDTSKLLHLRVNKIDQLMVSAK